MEEINYNELFGLEDVSDDAENVDDVDESEADSEGAESSETEEAPENEEMSEETSEGEGSSSADGQSEQTKEERAGFAAARRRAESEARAREAAAVNAAKDEAIRSTLELLGAKNPYSGKPIRTAAELEEYRASVGDRTKQQYMRSMGMNEDQYQEAVSVLPEVVNAQNKVKAAEERAKTAEAKIKETEDARFREELDREVASIAATGENVKTLEDITNLERYPEIREKIRRGYSLEDAYRSVYRDEIEKRSSARRAERAATAAASKNHLSRTKAKGEAGITVPGEVIEQYKAIMPGMSDADIIKHYSSYRKGKK